MVIDGTITKTKMLIRAIQVTFEARGTHPLPGGLTDPPSAWSTPFLRLAAEIGLGYSLSEATQAARRFLDPVLLGEAAGMWDPAAWSWQS